MKLMTCVLQDSEIFANGAAMKTAAEIVSDWRECEVGLRLMMFIGDTINVSMMLHCKSVSRIDGGHADFAEVDMDLE